MKSYLLGILSALTMLCAAASAQNVSLTLVPITYPIQIPASGGTFNYLAFFTNHDSVSLTCATWGLITPADNAIPNPVLGPTTIILPPGQTVGYYRGQPVPAAVHEGIYTFHAYVGMYPNTVWDSSSFQFEKMGLSGIVDPSAPPYQGPEQLTLGPTYPNPFNASTVLNYELRAAGHVSLRVYDTTGRPVSTLVDGWTPAGLHGVTFDGSKLASGIYLAKLEAGEFSAVQKLVLMK